MTVAPGLGRLRARSSHGPHRRHFTRSTATWRRRGQDNWRDPNCAPVTVPPAGSVGQFASCLFICQMRRQISYPAAVTTGSTRGRKSREAIYRQLTESVEELRDRLGGLPSPMEAQDIWGDIWYQEAHNSTAIEGNTLILREVELLLKEGRAVGDKQLAEYLEVRGYADAAQWVYHQGLVRGDWTTGQLITMTEVRHVHHLAMSKVWDVMPHSEATDREMPGSFREHNIQPFADGMRPPDWPDVQALMTDWVERASTLATSERPLPEALAKIHADFERIHPFLDGNGRAGRLVTNFLLIRLGYPPVIIRKGERARYLENLRRADAGDPGPLGEFVARAILDTLDAVHRARGRGTCTAGSPGRTGRQRSLGSCPPPGCGAWTPTRAARQPWPVAQHSAVGRRVQGAPIQALANSPTSSSPLWRGGHLRLGLRVVDLREPSAASRVEWAWIEYPEV